jgi:hypothetical protein
MVNTGPTGRRAGHAAALVVIGLTAIAAVLRFWRLGDWGLEGDEIFTLRDSLRPRLINPRPLIYFLNHYLVQPVMPLDELGLRVLPALFGVLAVPTFYLVARRLVGTRAALFGALFLTVSAVHIYHSQYARYWSLVFLLSAVYPYALYLGIVERDRRAFVVGIVTAILAVLAHPVAVLLVGGIAAWLALTYLRGDSLIRLWGQPTFRRGAVVAGVLAVVIGLRFVPILQRWISSHDSGTRVKEHLLHLPGRPGVKQIAYLMSYVDGLTVPLVLAGMLGVYLLWRGRNRSLGLLLACLAVLPVLFLTLLSFRTPVSTSYLLPAVPPIFIGAGVLLDRVAALEVVERPRWALAALITLAILHSGLATLVSQYRDGRRHDFRGVARWLDQRVAPGDVVYSDQAKVLSHYLEAPDAKPLVGDPAVLARAAAQANGLWIVKPYTAAGGHRTNPKIDALKRWIYDHCELRNTIGVARLDFRNNELQVYRCPTEPAREVPASSK